MEQTNTVVGKDGYPMVVTTGGHGNHGGYGYNNDYFANWAGINATNSGTTSILDAITNAENVVNKGVYDASVAGIKQTTDAAVSTTKAVTDYGMMNSDTSNRNATSITKAITDSSHSSENSLGRVHNEVLTSSADLRGVMLDAIARNSADTKDTQLAIYKDGCYTREKMAEQHAAVMLELCKCCAEDKALTIAENSATRDLIRAESEKRCEADNANLRQENLFLKLNGSTGHGGGNGNS